MFVYSIMLVVVCLCKLCDVVMIIDIMLWNFINDSIYWINHWGCEMVVDYVVVCYCINCGMLSILENCF